MIVDPDFLDHWKTRMLIVSLDGDPSAPLYVLRIWAHCQNRRQSEFDDLSPEALKALCCFPGNANKLESSLVASGFVRRDAKKIIVTGWAEYNASLIAAWRNGMKGGRPPNKPMGIPRITQGQTDRSRVDRIREEKTKHTQRACAPIRLPKKWDTPECVSVFGEWFAYLSKIGKPSFDRDQTACAAVQLFSCPEELVANIRFAMANEYRTLKAYLGSDWKRLEPPAADKRAKTIAEFMGDDT